MFEGKVSKVLKGCAIVEMIDSSDVVYEIWSSKKNLECCGKVIQVLRSNLNSTIKLFSLSMQQGARKYWLSDKSTAEIQQNNKREQKLNDKLEIAYQKILEKDKDEEDKEIMGKEEEKGQDWKDMNNMQFKQVQINQINVFTAILQQKIYVYTISNENELVQCTRKMLVNSHKKFFCTKELKIQGIVFEKFLEVTDLNLFKEYLYAYFKFHNAKFYQSNQIQNCIQGMRMRLMELRGKLVVLFWAIWMPLTNKVPSQPYTIYYSRANKFINNVKLSSNSIQDCFFQKNEQKINVFEYFQKLNISVSSNEQVFEVVNNKNKIDYYPVSLCKFPCVQGAINIQPNQRWEIVQSNLKKIKEFQFEQINITIEPLKDPIHKIAPIIDKDIYIFIEDSNQEVFLKVKDIIQGNFAKNISYFVFNNSKFEDYISNLRNDAMIMVFYHQKENYTFIKQTCANQNKVCQCCLISSLMKQTNYSQFFNVLYKQLNAKFVPAKHSSFINTMFVGIDVTHFKNKSIVHCFATMYDSNGKGYYKWCHKILEPDLDKQHREILDQITLQQLLNNIFEYARNQDLCLQKCIIFRDGFNVVNFKVSEQQFMLQWGTDNNIQVIPILIIKDNLVRILDSQQNYLKRCKVQLDSQYQVYSTALRQKASKPFLVYYEGQENIDLFINEACSQHYHFKNTKLPQPLLNADRNALWFLKYEIQINEDLTTLIPSL